MALAEWQERVDERVHDGGSLSDVEAEIIARSPLSPEQKAALWLYAWGLLSSIGRAHIKEW